MEENGTKSMLGERGGERGDDEEMGGSTMDCSIEMIHVEKEVEKEVEKVEKVGKGGEGGGWKENDGSE